jgi:DNA-binding LytR/AlgR family response regulator
MKLTCIFVEDETPAMNLLKVYAERVPSLDVLGYFDRSMDAIHFLNDTQVDLIFTDVNMPQMSGIELIQSLRTKPYVVFITSNAEHAVSGFELDITDFLVKPVTFDRFVKSVNKVIDRVENLALATTVNMQQQEVEVANDEAHTSMFVKENGKVIRIDFEEIMAIEGLKDYVKIICVGNKNVITHLTMKKLEEQILPKAKFMRIHKSFIVSTEQIRKFDGLDNCLELNNQLQIPVGPQYKEALLLKIKPVN